MNAEPIEMESPVLLANNTPIELPYGLLGFENVKKFVLLTRPAEEPFMWLKMVGHSEQSFLVISPFGVLPTYRPDVSNDDVEFLGLKTPEDALVLNIVTLRSQGQPTMNLKGPVIINRHTLIGKQVIPNNAARYSLRHPLPVG
jgi:flagellar assembly factor FliW